MPLLEGLRGLLGVKAARSAPGSGGLSELSASILIQEAGGRYAESAWNGELFTLTSGLVAAPTGTSPLAAGGTPVLALWNPASSGFTAFIRRIGALTTATGTVTPKAYTIDVGPTAAITQATVINAQKNDCSGGTDTDLKGFSAVALTGSSALQRLRPINAVGNAAAQNDVFSNAEEIGDAIIVLPGTLLAITVMVAGTANEVIAFLEYAKRRTT